MSKSRNKYLITQSLISSWLWSYTLDSGYADFLSSLERKRTPPTKAMLEGIRFENVVNATLDGAEIDSSHEWYEPICELYQVLHGSQQQVKLARDVTIGGVDFVLYGIFDFLKAGIIYDTKYSKTYHVGKYIDSPQHPMYFALCPEAYEFQYKICDGKYIYTERYRPDEVEPIEKTIQQFMGFLERQNLTDIYFENWRSKY